ncbi:retrotransposon protein, putative, ty3-gypsy subclass [Tanacetum coccineum]
MPPRRNRRNNGADPACAAAVEQAVTTLLPTLTTRITDEIRQNENNGNNGNRRNGRRRGNTGDAQRTDIHVWLERFMKQKPQSFSLASTPVEAKNWIAHIEKFFKVLGCDDQFKSRLATYKLDRDAHKKYEREYKLIRRLDGETSIEFMKRFLRLTGFLRAKAGTQEELAKNLKWGLSDFILDKIMNTKFTDVAQVANAARNIDMKAAARRVGPYIDTMTGRDMHGIKQCTDVTDHGHKGNNDKCDRHDNKRQRSCRDHDQHDWDQQYGRSYGSSSQMGYSDYASSPPCNLCGKLHLGKTCHRATGVCFTCGQVGHLAKDYKKGSASNGGNGNNKQPVTNGRVFALTTDQNLGTVSGTLSMYHNDVFVLFDTGATHFVVSFAFSKHIEVPSTLLDYALSISTPMKNNAVFHHEYRRVRYVLVIRFILLIFFL